MSQKLLVITGPTATGKTDLALVLAKKLDGELVACDSRQVYRGLDIGTGKEPGRKTQIEKSSGYWNINGVKIWMYDVVEPKVRYDVSRYITDTEKVLEKIRKQNKLPIIVGGTGLYLKGLLEGFSNLKILIDKNLRGELEKYNLIELQEKLESLSPTFYKELNDSDKNNPRRLIRDIELVNVNPYVNKYQISNTKSQNFNILKIGLTAPRTILYEKINSRVLTWLDHGIIEEAKNLRKKGLTIKKLKELGLEYGNIAEFLEGKINYKELIDKMQTKTRQYSKRQITWFKRDKDIFWVDVTKRGWQEKVEKKVYAWYNA